MNDCDDESGDDDGGTAWDVKAWEWSDLDWRSCDDSGTAWDAGADDSGTAWDTGHAACAGDDEKWGCRAFNGRVVA